MVKFCGNNLFFTWYIDLLSWKVPIVKGSADQLFDWKKSINFQYGAVLAWVGRVCKILMSDRCVTSAMCTSLIFRSNCVIYISKFKLECIFYECICMENIDRQSWAQFDVNFEVLKTWVFDNVQERCRYRQVGHYLLWLAGKFHEYSFRFTCRMLILAISHFHVDW